MSTVSGFLGTMADCWRRIKKSWTQNHLRTIGAASLAVSSAWVAMSGWRLSQAEPGINGALVAMIVFAFVATTAPLLETSGQDPEGRLATVVEFVVKSPGRWAGASSLLVLIGAAGWFGYDVIPIVCESASELVVETAFPSVDRRVSCDGSVAMFSLFENNVEQASRVRCIVPSGGSGAIGRACPWVSGGRIVALSCGSACPEREFAKVGCKTTDEGESSFEMLSAEVSWAHLREWQVVWHERLVRNATPHMDLKIGSQTSTGGVKSRSEEDLAELIDSSWEARLGNLGPVTGVDYHTAADICRLVFGGRLPTGVEWTCAANTAAAPGDKFSLFVVDHNKQLRRADGSSLSASRFDLGRLGNGARIVGLLGGPREWLYASEESLVAVVRGAPPVPLPRTWSSTSALAYARSHLKASPKDLQSIGVRCVRGEAPAPIKNANAASSYHVLERCGGDAGLVLDGWGCVPELCMNAHCCLDKQSTDIQFTAALKKCSELTVLGGARLGTELNADLEKLTLSGQAVLEFRRGATAKIGTILFSSGAVLRMLGEDGAPGQAGPAKEPAWNSTGSGDYWDARNQCAAGSGPSVGSPGEPGRDGRPNGKLTVGCIVGPTDAYPMVEVRSGRGGAGGPGGAGQLLRHGPQFYCDGCMYNCPSGAAGSTGATPDPVPANLPERVVRSEGECSSDGFPG